MILIPKNWREFQHYKDRLAPWVKLHKSILDDRDFACLPIASKALAPLLWLLASESNDGSFDASVDELMFRLRWSEKDIKTGLKPLIDKGLFIIYSNTLASCEQVAVPEKRRERGETETEGETETDDVCVKKFNAKKFLESYGADPDLASEFLAIRKTKKKQNTERAIKPIADRMIQHNTDINVSLDFCCQKTWADFNAAWLAEKSSTNSAYDRKMKTLSGLTGGIHGNSDDAHFKPISEVKTIDMEASNANLLR